jgi:hypothetical protein
VIVGHNRSLVGNPVVKKLTEVIGKPNESFSVFFVLDRRSGLGTMMHFEILFVRAIIVEVQAVGCSDAHHRVPEEGNCDVPKGRVLVLVLFEVR